MSCNHNHPGARRECVWRDVHRFPRAGTPCVRINNFFSSYGGARRAFTLSAGELCAQSAGGTPGDTPLGPGTGGLLRYMVRTLT